MDIRILKTVYAPSGLCLVSGVYLFPTQKKASDDDDDVDDDETFRTESSSKERISNYAHTFRLNMNLRLTLECIQTSQNCLQRGESLLPHCGLDS